MASQQSGPPYPSTIAGPGGMPTPGTDVPILSVLIVLYAGSAAGHMTIFQLNRRKGHKFVPSVMLFAFSMARIVTCSLRIGQAYHSTDVSLGIAANIFLQAGILVVYIVNLLFAQRILRATHPKLGWSLPLRILFGILYALVAVFLVLLIVFIVYSSYTLEPHWHQVTRNVQLGAATTFVILTATPLLIIAIAHLLPASPEVQSFGNGSMAMKSLILGVSSTLCLLGAGFKAGITWEAPRPISDPAWYQSKACLYVFYFVLEVLILFWYLANRVDRRFYVPDGSGKRKSYHVDEAAKRIQPQTSCEASLADRYSEKGSEV